MARATPQAARGSAVAFVAAYIVIAFALMLVIGALGLGMYVTALVGLLAHGVAGAVAYRLILAGEVADGRQPLDEAIETCAVALGVFAALKHAVLGLSGLAAAAGGLGAVIDGALTGFVELTYTGTSMVADVALVGAVPLAARLAAGIWTPGREGGSAG